MKPTERVIIVFGLAASGKSTLASRLARHLGLRVVHPSGVMRQLLAGQAVVPEESVANDGYWESPEGSQILDSRLEQSKPVDVEANNILLQEVAKGDVVIDSWSLPWLTDRGVRFHLKSPLAVRARRAAERAGITPEEAALLIAKKDEDTRALFSRLYGFDIFADLDGRFDLTMETEGFSEDEVFRRALGFLSGHGWSMRR